VVIFISAGPASAVVGAMTAGALYGVYESGSNFVHVYGQYSVGKASGADVANAAMDCAGSGANAAMMLDGAGEVEEAGKLGDEGLQCLREGGCFVAGTIVQTEHGPEPIEKIKKGEKVWTRNPLTGKTELTDPKTGKTAQSITGTAEHLFFTPGGKMIPMGHLRVGQQIVSRDGEALVVQTIQIRHVEEGVSVYNLTVEDDHTYFVGSADGGEWVHNACPQLFENTLPDRLSGELARADALGAKPFAVGEEAFDEALDTGTGRVKWAVTPDRGAVDGTVRGGRRSGGAYGHNRRSARACGR